MFKLNHGFAPLLLVAMAVAMLTGCSGSGQQMEVASDYEQMLTDRDQEIKRLRDTVKDQTVKIEGLEDAVTSSDQAREQAYADMDHLRKADSKAMANGDLFPPAKPGECYTRVFVPATYEQTSEQVLHKGATSTVSTVPAAYEWVEERIKVEPASYKLETVPASYEWQEERILVREARTEWKRGRGPIEKVDSNTGEIMCLIEIPAEYKTVRKQVEVAAATTKRVEIPARYETVKVQKLVREAREERVAIPAEYQTVTRWVKTSDGHMEWREIVCETNMGGDLVKRMQVALRDHGHNPGPIDGVIGSQTMTALHGFQKQESLAVGGVTYESLERMGL